MVLSIGSIEKIKNSTDISGCPHDPILQILAIKVLGNNKRLKIALSDGKNIYRDFIFTGNAKDIAERDKIKELNIVKILRYMPDFVSGRKIIFCTEIELLSKDKQVDKMIGEPIDITDVKENIVTSSVPPPVQTSIPNITPISSHNPHPTFTHNPIPASTGNPVSTSTHNPVSTSTHNPVSTSTHNPVSISTHNPTRTPIIPESVTSKENINKSVPLVKPQEYTKSTQIQTHGKRSTSSSAFNQDVSFIPIISLTPYNQSKSTIRARVSTKSNVRTYRNSKGDGKLFSLTFIDETGEIKATVFNDTVDLFYNMFELKKVYYISNVSVKAANKKYNSGGNDYEMILNTDTVIKECVENIELPNQKYNFIEIPNIINCNKDTFIDVNGIIVELGEIVYITSKSNSRQLTKRDIVIGDNSGMCVNLSLWGEHAESEIYTLGSVIAVKSTKVSDYNGKSLNSSPQSQIEINPDIPSTHKLINWYRSIDPDTKFKSISVSNMGSTHVTNFKNIKDISNKNNVSTDKAEYSQIIALFEKFKSDNIIYMACPTPNCNKKVIEEGSDMYRCEKCNRSFSNYSPRLMNRVVLYDSTGMLYCTFFNDAIEKLTQSTAIEIDHARIDDAIKFDEILSRPAFQRYVFSIRSNLDTYNDESRIKFTCTDVRPLHFVNDGRVLISKINNICH